MFYFGEESLNEEGIELQCRGEGGDAGVVFFCGEYLVHQAFGGDLHYAEGQLFAGDGSWVLESEGFAREIDGEGFEGRVPAIVSREMEQPRAAAGVGEMQLEGYAFVVLVFRDGFKFWIAEEETGVVEGVDEQFGNRVAFGQGAGLELVDIADCVVAFLRDGCVAGPVSALESDFADGRGVYFVQVMELGEGLAGWFFYEDRLAGLQQPDEDLVMGFRCGANENTGDCVVFEDDFEIVGKDAAGEEGG